LISTVKLLYGASVINYIPDYPAGATVEQDGASSLFVLNNLVTTSGNNLVTTSGNNLVLRKPDTISIELIDSVIPAGVKVTIVQI